MSSKVFDAGEQPVRPLVWRQVRGPVPPPGDSPAPDLEARIVRLQQEAELRVSNARATALTEGEAAGRARAAAEFQAVVDRLSATIQELAALRPRLRREAESDMVKLSLAIARRVLRRELAIDPEALHGLVLGALEKLQGQEVCRVRTHPSHAASISAILRQSAAGAAIEVTPDPAREPGSVVFETTRGNLDASVETQLQEIERGLIDRLRLHP